jgi:hypothetical protein
MGWDKGRYYTRSKKVNGRVVREYIGAGELAELVAQQDILEREKRLLSALDRRDQKAELAALDGELKALSEQTDLVASAALLAAGFHQHKRGEWRKRRGNRKCAELDRSDRPDGTEEGSGARPPR